MFSFKPVPYRYFIEAKEFTDHPVGIGHDPKTDSQVVCQFRLDTPGAVSNNKRDYKGWEDHGDAQHFPDKAPAYIL